MAVERPHARKGETPDEILALAHDVFISHSQRDKTAADAACNVFERNGIRCWMAPRDIEPGRQWADAIVEAIGNCKALVLVFSGSSNASEQVSREVDRAISKNIVVIPVRIEDVLPSRSMEYYLSTSHWLDAFPPPYERSFEAISDRIKAVIGRTTETERRPGTVSSEVHPRRVRVGRLVWSAIALVAIAALSSVALVLFTSVGGACRDVPADFPESEQSRVTSFKYLNLGDPNQPRLWNRDPDKVDLWKERSFENRTEPTTTTVFGVKGRTHVASCDGTIVGRDDDTDLQLLIADRTCHDKTLRFRRPKQSGCRWIALPIMRDINKQD